MIADVVLRRGREKPVLNHHPWVFSGAVHRIEGETEDGGLVQVVDSRGRYLGTGYLNRRSQIVVRLLTWDREIEIDDRFWLERLRWAIDARQRVAGTNALRLVHAEADLLPGLIVDRYDDWLIMQCLTLGMDRRRDLMAGLLAQLLAPAGIYARDDADVRLQEGLPLESGVLWGKAPPDRIVVAEHGHRFLVDVREGHKTGFYLDQRDNRLRASTYCAGADALNAFAYTGGFGVYAAGAGARTVVNVDSSEQALDLAEENLDLNGYSPQEMVLGDVFQVLRDYREAGRTFDVVILDPPKFATSQAQVMDATRGYKDINMLAFQLLRPGGTLITFSCSGRVSADLFQKVVFGASVDAGRDAQIVEHLFQGPDHPVLLTFPESAYLKGFICRVW
ncbi:MAG: class I SAM-dependent rRNA methyltransferase [Anaerolineae bacterium]|jgi:23S rRNA (cytosine1962-C5)-methyltransferase